MAANESSKFLALTLLHVYHTGVLKFSVFFNTHDTIPRAMAIPALKKG